MITTAHNAVALVYIAAKRVQPTTFHPETALAAECVDAVGAG